VSALGGHALPWQASLQQVERSVELSSAQGCAPTSDWLVRLRR
jgi:hypothetical protein